MNSSFQLSLIQEQGTKAWNNWREENPSVIPELNNVSLIELELEGIDLNNAKLEGANLEGANLTNANLKGTKLEGANLENANLKGANFVWADLTSANLKGANFEGANLEWANLTRAEVYGANLDGAKIDKTTTMDYVDFGPATPEVNARKAEAEVVHSKSYLVNVFVIFTFGAVMGIIISAFGGNGWIAMLIAGVFYLFDNGPLKTLKALTLIVKQSRNGNS